MSISRRAKGFSLFELLVVIAILGVTSTLGVVMLSKIHGPWSEVKSEAELDGKAEYAFKQIRLDLASVVDPDLTGALLSGETADHEDTGFGDVKLADDTLSIPVRGKDADGVQVLAGVKYSVQTIEGGRRLMRINTLLYGGSELAMAEAAEGVVHFRVEYSDKEGAWRTSWNTPALPNAVRVSLVLSDPDRLDYQISRKAVFPININ